MLVCRTFKRTGMRSQTERSEVAFWVRMHPVVRDDNHCLEQSDHFRMEVTQEPQSQSAYFLSPPPVTSTVELPLTPAHCRSLKQTGMRTRFERSENAFWVRMHPVVRDDSHCLERSDHFRMEVTQEPQSQSAYFLSPLRFL